MHLTRYANHVDFKKWPGFYCFFSIINERNILFVMIKLGLTQPDVGDGILFFFLGNKPNGPLCGHQGPIERRVVLLLFSMAHAGRRAWGSSAARTSPAGPTLHNRCAASSPTMLRHCPASSPSWVSFVRAKHARGRRGVPLLRRLPPAHGSAAR
jgi:hypothetical protein